MTVEAPPLFERADHCLAALDDAGRTTARRVVLRLVRLEGPGARRQALAALETADDPARVTDVVRRLADAGAVSLAGEGPDAQVELDDALLAWPTLQAWVRSHGAPEQVRRQLESDAAEWSRRTTEGAADPGLLDKAQLRELARALPADATRDLGVTSAAEAYLTASRAAARRGWWPGRNVVGTVLALLLPLLLLATPIVLLFIVVLSAWMIHRFG